MAAALILNFASLSSLNFAPLTRGQLLVVPNFIPPELTVALRTDLLALQAAGAFRPSGLSNAAAPRSNRFGASDRLVCRPSAVVGGDVAARAELERRVEAVRQALGTQPHRSRALDTAELYASAHPPGASLPLHMDERHEEAKGGRGWRTSTRRSVSWLLYLSDTGWGAPGGAGGGGALRAYTRPRARAGAARGGADEGNLQVGWRLADDGWEDAVYLDAWVRCRASATGCASRLYARGRAGERRWVGAPFVSAEGAGVAGCVGALPPAEAARFAPIEWADGAAGLAAALASGALAETRVEPTGGTLVLFDSVSVPHEVLPTERGVRWAVAGWMHEPQQRFPAWFGRAGAAA